jgi:hypothetical protein
VPEPATAAGPGTAAGKVLRQYLGQELPLAGGWDEWIARVEEEARAQVEPAAEHVARVIGVSRTTEAMRRHYPADHQFGSRRCIVLRHRHRRRPTVSDEATLRGTYTGEARYTPAVQVSPEQWQEELAMRMGKTTMASVDTWAHWLVGCPDWPAFRAALAVLEGSSPPSRPPL